MCANIAGYIGVIHVLGEDYTTFLSYPICDSASALKKLGGHGAATLPPNAGWVSHEQRPSYTVHISIGRGIMAGRMEKYRGYSRRGSTRVPSRRTRLARDLAAHVRRGACS